MTDKLPIWDTLIEKLGAELEKSVYEGADYRSGLRKQIAIVRQHQAEISAATLKSGDINATENGDSMGYLESGRTATRLPDIVMSDDLIERVANAIGEAWDCPEEDDERLRVYARAAIKAMGDDAARKPGVQQVVPDSAVNPASPTSELPLLETKMALNAAMTGGEAGSYQHSGQVGNPVASMGDSSTRKDEEQSGTTVPRPRGSLTCFPSCRRAAPHDGPCCTTGDSPSEISVVDKDEIAIRMVDALTGSMKHEEASEYVSLLLPVIVPHLRASEPVMGKVSLEKCVQAAMKAHWNDGEPSTIDDITKAVLDAAGVKCVQ